MSFRGQRSIPDSYRPPAKDSAQAKANATCWLYGCTEQRLVDATPAGVARDYGLSERTAEYMLTVARHKRGVANGL